MDTFTPGCSFPAPVKSKRLTYFLLAILLIVFSAIASAQPNNNCASATVLTVGAACTNGTNVGATLEAGETTGATGTGCWASAPSNTVWYTFTTGAAGNYTVSTDNGGSTDTEIKIFSGTCGAFTLVACNEDGGTANTFAAVAAASLAASTTYYIQVDVFGGTTATFCINITYNPPIANDCIFNAIDITPQINGINSTTNPFDCATYTYAAGGSVPTTDNVNGNTTACDAGPDFRDIWFSFTITASTPDVWIDVYQATGTAPDYVAAIYRGTPSGTCGAGTITGLTLVDCSDGAVAGGALDVGVCTTPLHPRINAATLAPGTYYYRVWEWGGGTPVNGIINLCVESATPVGVTSDACPSAPTMAFGCGSAANVNINETYTNLANSGCLGNACNTSVNEPQLAVGGAGQIRNNCAGAWLTSVGYANNVMNNSAIYAFNVNGTGSCQATVTIRFNNITYAGTTGNVMQVQVMSAPCGGGSTAVMAGTTADPCFEMRSATGTLPNGTYYIVVDGQDGQLMQYDLNLQITYGGLGCTPTTPPTAPTAVNAGRCGTGTVTLSVSGCSGTPNWYAAATGGTALATGSSFTTPSLSVTTTYYASCTVSGCESARVPVVATINAIPTVPTAGNSGPVCVGAPLSLSANTLTGTYSWTGPNGFTSSSEDPSVSASATTAMAGTYSVTLTSNGCTSAAGTTVVTVNTIPTAPTAGNNGPVCAGSALSLSANTLTGTYSWTGPNGFTSSSEDPSVNASATAAMAGTYSVTLTTNGCTSAAGTTVVTVNTIPTTPTAGNNGPVCVGSALSLSANTLTGTYSWTGPNGFTSSSEDPSVSASATAAMAGTYSVTLTSNGCTSAPGTTIVTVNTIPTAPTAGNNGPVCVGSALSLSANTLTGTYSWTGPNGFVSSLEDPSVSASATTSMAGTYSVTLTSNGCTSAAGTTVVTVNTIPTAPTAGNNGPVCVGAALSLSANTLTGTYSWTGPNGFTSSSEDPSVSASATTSMAGTYSVTLTSNGCTSAAGTTVVTVNTIPTTPTAGNNGPVCVGAALSLSANTLTGTYSWTGPNGFVSSLEDPSVSANATTAMAGTYSVTLTSNGCTSAAGTTVVTVNTIPTAPTAGNNGPVCVGSSLSLSANTLTGTYSWTGPNGFISLSEDPSVSASATTAMAGTYSVTLTSNGCTSAAGTTVVTINTIPTAPTAGNNGPVCVGAALSLSANTLTGTYSWTGPNGFVSSLEDPSVSASATTGMAGTYSVTLTSNGCTSAAGTTVVTVNTIPTAPTAGNNGPVCVGSALSLSANTLTGTYSWTGPNGFTSSSEDPSVSASATTAMAGTYSVTLTSNGCTSAAGTTVVTVNTIPTAPTAGNNGPVCVGSALSLSANTLTGTYSWTGPNGFTSSSEDPSVSASATTAMAGTYSVTLTVSGCTSAAGTTTVVVNPPVLPTAGNNGPVCAGSALGLTANTVAGATYSWTGPNGFISSSEDPSVSASATAPMAGTYSVTITVNGCVSPAGTTTVAVNAIPNVNAGSDKTLSCVSPSVTLDGSSSTSGVAFSWAGPGGFSSSAAVPSSSTAGTYTLTVSVNNCSASDQMTVNPAVGAPDVNAGTSQTLTCTATTATLNGSSITPGVNYSWAGPGITSGGNSTTPTVNAAGSYTLTVTDPGSGCSATDQVAVTANNTAPNANGGGTQTINCSSSSVILNGSSSTGGTTFSWAGPGIVSGGNTATPTVNTAGTYTVTVSDPSNGCTATAQAIVNSNTTAPNANAGSSQTLSCSATTVSMNGSSSTGGATFSWTGPGIISGGNTATPTVNAAGTYTVTVSDPANGCTATAQAMVNSNTTAPNANAGTSQTLSCSAVTVNLNGSSSTSGATFNWSGPGIVSGGNTATPTVNTAGTYTLTVTDPANGCTAPSQVVVNSNTAAPNANAGTAQTLTCAASSVALNGSSSTSGATFSWGGPGIVSGGNTATPTVNTAGTYTLTVTDPSNGCSAPSQVVVNSNSAAPDANAGNTQTLTCSAPSVTLNGSSATGGATFSWSGPGIVSGANTATPSVNAAGTYTLTVTDPSNGCSAPSQVVVNASAGAPNANAGPAQTLDCSNTSLNLTGSSSTSGATFSWAGPGIISGGNTAAPTVNAAGTYTLTVTDPSNGCSAPSQVVVNSNTSPPDANAGSTQTLTCSSPSVMLNGSSANSSATYGWAGPGIISGGNTATPTVNAAGTYTLTVTDPSNGCSAQGQVSVNVAAGVPDANAGASPTLNCTSTSVNLNGSSATSGTTFSWAGPGIISGGNTATPTVNAAGTYTLTVTDPSNGCSASAQVVTNSNTAAPNADAGASQTLTCSAASVTLNGSSSTSGTSFSWAGPGIASGGNTATPTVNAAGTYTLTVTDPSNGCSAPSQVVVNSNTAAPVADAGTSQALTCSAASTTLNGSSSATGALYSWAGPGIVSGGSSATPSVNTAGTYTVTCTDPANGCSATAQVVVSSNTNAPDANAGTTQTLTCSSTSVTLNGSSATSGVTFSWGGPGIVSGGNSATPSVNAAGTYTLTVTDPSNGCSAPSQVSVNAAAGAPDANAGTSPTLSCAITSVSLNGSSATSGATFSWAGPGIISGGNTATPTVNAAGTYTLTVTDPANGCSAPAQVVVNTNTSTPNSNAGAAQTLTCASPSATLNGSSSTSGATFSWTGAGIVSGGSTATPVVNAAGTYTLTVTDPANGCTSSSQVAVNAAAGVPNANAGATQTLNCIATSVSLGGSSTTSGTTFSWMGPGITSGANTATPTVNAAGTYTLTVTDPANGCSATAQVVVNSNTSTPNANAGTAQTLTCSSTSVTLNGSSATSGATFSWSGPGIVSGGNTATPSVNAAGNYTIIVTDPANGCSATAQVTVNAAAGAPNANAGTAQTLTCTTSSATLNGSSSTSGATFSWAGPGIISGGNTATPTVNAAGTYTLTVTDPANGCSAPAQVTVSSNAAAPSVSAGTGQALTCTSASVTLNGSSSTSGATYSWTGPGIVSGGNTATPVVNAAGTYTLTVTNPTNGCNASSTVSVAPAAGISVNAGPDVSIVSGSIATLQATGGTSYSWTPSAGLSCNNCPDPVARPSVTTTYCVLGATGSCTDNDCVTVTVHMPCGTNEELGVPNAFSPNNDGNNDLFCLQGWSECMTEFSILIYDRWGEKVFEASAANFCWDGIYRGKTLDPAVFVYIIKAKFITGDDVVKKGNISIIK